MKRPQLISQGSLNRMLQTAAEAWAHHDYQQSFELLERASRLQPSNFNILLELGQRHGLRYQPAEAERAFEQAVRVAPHKAEVLQQAGRLSAEAGHYRMAERFFKLALEQTNVTAETIARLAELYERLHRPADAAAMVDRALGLDPTCPLARLTQARLHRQAGQLDEAGKVLQPALTAHNRELRFRSLYELGAIYDRQARYDEAMAAFLAAKNLMLPQATSELAERKRFHGRLKMIESNISSEMLQKWQAADNPQPSPRRVGLLAGHPRSGTTLLEQVLDSHPDIVSAEETTIFLDDTFATIGRHSPPNSYMLPVLESASAPLRQEARASYFRSMELCLGEPIAHRLLLDKNPVLTTMIPAICRIFPEAKILIALRDPRDVVLSCFMQPLLLNPITATYLSLGETAEEYASVMGFWRTLAPLLANPHLEVRYEDMVDDLEAVARQTLEFLGMPWDATVLGFDAHARKKLVRSPTYADVTQPVYQRARGRWHHYQKYLEPHLEKLEPFVKAFGYE